MRRFIFFIAFLLMVMLPSCKQEPPAPEPKEGETVEAQISERDLTAHLKLITEKLLPSSVSDDNGYSSFTIMVLDRERAGIFSDVPEAKQNIFIDNIWEFRIKTEDLFAESERDEQYHAMYSWLRKNTEIFKEA